MTPATHPPPLMTADELLALPDDGVERWLIRGRLRQVPRTFRDRFHARVTARAHQVLANWLDEQPTPRGSVLGGEAGVRLRRNPDTVVGIDAIYISPELAAQEPADTSLIDGVPTLAVEILSPGETQEIIDEKIDGYLACGVPLVWVVDPHDETVTIYRPGQPPTMVNTTQELSGEPHLPGFRAAVTRLFAR